jgi:hypothetical protein
MCPKGAEGGLADLLTRLEAAARAGQVDWKG